MSTHSPVTGRHEYVMLDPRTDAWRDTSRKPRGMQRFSKWMRRRSGTRAVTPSDIDGVLHSRIGNRILLLEFKPLGRAPNIPAAQAETLASFSARPGIQALVVFAPGWDDEGDDRFPDTAPVKLILFRDGRAQTCQTTTMAVFSTAVADWYVNDGPLST